MKKLITIFLSLCVTIPLTAQKRAFTLDYLYKVKSVVAPHFSPDGKSIVFYVNETFLETGKSNSEIYVMKSDGSDLRQMTSNKAADFSPSWSNDGSSIYFLSTREDGVQLWQLPVDGGEAKLTDFPSASAIPSLRRTEPNSYSPQKFSPNVAPMPSAPRKSTTI